MQPNTCNLLADFSQNRSVETPLKPVPRTFHSSPPMRLNKLKLHPSPVLFVVILSLSLTGRLPAQALQHFHVTAGAVSTSAGSQLYFTDANTFLAESGYVAYMPRITNNLLPTIGYHMGGPTFTAASNDGSADSPAAAGARLALVVRAVDGPPGARWSFWEAGDDEEYGETITFSYATGTTNGTNAIVLSENNGQPGADPYGHIHGRAFTVDQPGLYSVWVQLVDISRNGPGGGALHTPSPVYRYHYQAGTTISRLERANSNVVVTFGTQLSNAARRYSYYLEAHSAPGAEETWTTVAGPVTGNNRLQTMSDPLAQPWRLYRLRVASP